MDSIDFYLKMQRLKTKVARYIKLILNKRLVFEESYRWIRTIDFICIYNIHIHTDI